MVDYTITEVLEMLDTADRRLEDIETVLIDYHNGDETAYEVVESIDNIIHSVYD